MESDGIEESPIVKEDVNKLGDAGIYNSNGNYNKVLNKLNSVGDAGIYNCNGNHKKGVQSVRVGSTEVEEECDFLENIPPVWNGVTLSLDGSPELVAANFEACIGHQRLCCFLNGFSLDLSSIIGPGKVLCSTRAEDTFYFTFIFTENFTNSEPKLHKITLVIDWQDGWNYGFTNEHGVFEYYHNYIPYMPCDQWRMLEFPGNYSSEGIAPFGLEDNEMGLSAVRSAVKCLSEYKGAAPTPLSVRKACGVLVSIGCESFKLHTAFHWNKLALLSGSAWTNRDCFPLAKMMKKWSHTSEGIVNYFVCKLVDPHNAFEAKLPPIPGVLTVEDALNMVAIVPKNKVCLSENYTRTWIWSPRHPEAGEPHIHSRLFLRKFPFNEQIAHQRSVDRSIDLNSALVNAAALRVRPGGLAASAIKKQIWTQNINLLR